MIARYGGPCPYCGKLIIPNEDEILQGAGGWGHKHCIENPIKPVEKNAFKQESLIGWCMN